MERHTIVLLAFAILVVASPAAYAYLGIDVLGADDPSVNVQLGMGIDLVIGQPKLIGVTGVHDTSSLPTLEYSLYLVETKEDLAKAMRVSVGAKGDTLIWAAEGKASFYTSFTREVDTVALFVSVKVTTQIERFRDNPALDPSAIQACSSPDQFLESYGNAYVSAIRSGGELYGVLYIHNITEIARESLSIHLSGRYKVYSGYADFDAELQEITQSENTELELRCKGGAVNLPGRPSVDDLLRIARDFPQTVSQPDKAYPMEVEVSSYDPLVTDEVWRALNDLARANSLCQKYTTILDRLDYIYFHPSEFVDVNDLEIEEAREDVARIIDAITEYLKDPAKGPPPTPTFRFEWPIPKVFLFLNEQIAAKEEERESQWEVPHDLDLVEPNDSATLHYRLRLADFYEVLAGLYEARQFVSAYEMDANSLVLDYDAYKAALYFGISYYTSLDETQGLRAKGLAELQYAMNLEKTLARRREIKESPVIGSIVGSEWPRGADGDLVIDLPGTKKTLAAGSVMDFNRIYIAAGCQLSIVADGDPRIHKYTAVTPSPRYARNPYWHQRYVTSFDTDTTARYLTGSKVFDEPLAETRGTAGAVTILGCRTDCRIEGIVDYNGLEHSGGTWTAQVPVLFRYQSLTSEIVQAPGGSGGNGCRRLVWGSDYPTGSSGGAGTGGYGGGGGGGIASSQDCICAGGDGGSCGQMGGGANGGQKRTCGYEPYQPFSPESCWAPGHSGGGPGGRATAEFSPGDGDHYRSDRFGGNGGTGGTRGTHGGALCIKVWGNLLGSGLIDLGGGRGGDGASGQNGRYGPFGGDEDPGNHSWQCGGGGGGGGGAGGSGGDYWLFHAGSVSRDLRVNVKGGHGGSGGERGTGGAYSIPPATVDWQHDDEIPQDHLETRFRECLCSDPDSPVHGRPGQAGNPGDNGTVCDYPCYR